MQLLVDIGNTSIKWALHAADADEPHGFGAAMHGGALPLDLLAAWDALDGIDAVVAAGVGPRAVKDAVVQVCESRFGRVPRWIETRAEAGGVRIAYAEPARLGVDRFLALVAAHRLGQADTVPAPALIVDAGTAVTYDLLQADGRHLGGLILPGVRLMRDSLLAGTQIPRYEPAEADLAWAADTGEAIAAASIQAPAALTERLQRRLHADTGTPPRLILTGGDAERLAAAIEHPPEALPALVPDLVLRGLAALAAD
jgi:type III pantothenate kinase